MLKALKGTEDGERFWHRLETFLKRYGYVWADRYPRDPAWQVHQDSLVATLSTLAVTAPKDGFACKHERQKRHRVRVIKEITQRLTSPRWLSFRLTLFRKLLRRAECLYPHKENCNHYVYRGIAVIQNYVREVGRRLQVRDVLDEKSDICFLTLAEIQQLLSHDRPPPEVKEKIEHRKRNIRVVTCRCMF